MDSAISLVDGTSGRWKDLIVLCAANNYDAIKLHDQHMGEQLAALGPVLYVDPPLSLLSARKNATAAKSLEGPRLREVRPGLARLTPVVAPFPSRPGMIGVTTFLSRRLLRQAVAKLGGNVKAVISGWPMNPVLGSCGERVKVYWAQDDFVGGAALLGMNANALDRNERKSAANADVIIAANPSVADTWRERGYDPLLIPFGADTGAYSAVDGVARPGDVTLPSPVAGFIGHINARIDLRLLEAIAGRGMSLLLVGPMGATAEKERWAALLARPNVQWVGPKPFASLPGYMGAIDVGLVPYDDGAFNRGSFPLKTLEYLAAGRAVVSTGLPATRWLNSQFIAIADEPGAFADAVQAAGRQPKVPADMAGRRAFAAGHDWALRARAFVAAIDRADSELLTKPK